MAVEIAFLCWFEIFSLFEAWFTVKGLEKMKWFTLEHFNINAADKMF